MAKEYNRWLIVLGAIIIQLCLGVVYSWSVFLNPLMAQFGWSKTATSFAFTLSVVFWAGVSILAGRLQDKYGPRIIASIGGVLVGLGFLMASQTTSLPWLYVAYGGLVGAGIGFGYICPVATSVKWFPDKRGLITGVALAMFGAGSLLLAPLAAQIIHDQGWQSAFLTLGITLFVAIIIGAQLLRAPPEGWKPKGWKPKADSKIKHAKYDYPWREMIRTKEFWMLWATLAFGVMSGLMVIGHLASYGLQIGLTATTAALVVGIFAVFNGLGRIFWGGISDRIGRTQSLLLMFAIQALVMLCLINLNTFLLLSVGAALIATCFGGSAAVFPALTSEYFGTKNIGVNYGWVFSGFGFAAVVGPMLAAWTFDSTKSYFIAFLFGVAFCIIAAILCAFLKPPKKNR